MSVAQAWESEGERDIFAVGWIDQVSWFRWEWRVPWPKLIGNIRILETCFIYNLRCRLPRMSRDIGFSRVMTVITSSGSGAATSTRSRQLPLLRVAEKELLVRP